MVKDMTGKKGIVGGDPWPDVGQNTAQTHLITIRK